MLDSDLPDGLRKQIENTGTVRVQVGDRPYACYPLTMSTMEGMWAPGMEPLRFDLYTTE